MSNKCAPRGFQNWSYRKEKFKDSLIVVNVWKSSGGSAGVLREGRSYRRQVASPWRVGVGIEQTARSLPPRRGRRRWLAPPTPYSIPSAPEIFAIAQGFGDHAPTADHQDSVSDIIPAGPLKTPLLVASRMPFRPQGLPTLVEL